MIMSSHTLYPLLPGKSNPPCGIFKVFRRELNLLANQKRSEFAIFNIDLPFTAKEEGNKIQILYPLLPRANPCGKDMRVLP